MMWHSQNFTRLLAILHAKRKPEVEGTNTSTVPCSIVQKRKIGFLDK